MNDFAIPCMLMRGGTSKGPLFLASDLPGDPVTRDDVLLSLMGSPDIRQIDGIGGGDSLTSQALIVGGSKRDDADVDYLFAQVSVAQRTVDTSPNCGNMLAAVACFAIERGLVAPADGLTCVRLYNLNTGRRVHARVPTPNRQLVLGLPGAPERRELLRVGSTKAAPESTAYRAPARASSSNSSSPRARARVRCCRRATRSKRSMGSRCRWSISRSPWC